MLSLVFLYPNGIHYVLKNLAVFNDFTGINVFKEASVDTCVIQIKKDFVEEKKQYQKQKVYSLSTKNAENFV